MSQNRDSYVRRAPLTAERYAAAADLPLAPRACVRLARAIENGLKQPQRSRATLRRAILSLAPQLRVAGMSDERIVVALAQIAEEIAATKALDAQSLVTGRPRWRELQDKIEGWVAESV